MSVVKSKIGGMVLAIAERAIASVKTATVFIDTVGISTKKYYGGELDLNNELRQRKYFVSREKAGLYRCKNRPFHYLDVPHHKPIFRIKIP
ncbi:MAG: hypothetical protein ACPGVO_03380 [Spirulinaceae cyanobacterium]